MPAWAGANAKAIFTKEFEVPIFTDNESNCAAVAEMMWGAASDEKDVVLLNIDLGVGGAVESDGRVIKGSAGGAGEFGLISIQQNGRLCRCGNRGCLEMSARVFLI